VERDKGAAEEIAVGAGPAAALAPASRRLFERDQPVAFDGGLVSEEVGIGRAGPLDDADAAQKIDPAARSAK
jgi:hypothetical protein